MLFNELNANEKATIKCLVKKIEEKETKNAKPYVMMTLTDGKADITANMWDVTAETVGVTAGTVIDAELKCLNYQGQNTYTVERFSSSENQTKDEFIRTAPVDAEKMFAQIYGLTEKLPSDLKAVTQYILTENIERYKTWNGAMTVHHAYKSGLMYHCYRMLQVAIAASRTYKVNAGLLVSGIILHDIGKLHELNVDELYAAEYTVEGYGLGHAALGLLMLERAITALGLPETENLMLLKNIIASHHLTPEHGAIARPISREALVIAMLDNMDAKIEIFEEELSEMEPGTVSKRIKYFDNTVVYRPEGRTKKQSPVTSDEAAKVCEALS